MPPEYVLDASALVKLFKPEARAVEFRAWMIEAIGKGAHFHAPTLLGYELASAVAREAHSHREELLQRLLDGIRLEDGFVGTTSAKGITTYDASYLVVAQRRLADLVTYDDDLAQAAKAGGIACVSP